MKSKKIIQFPFREDTGELLTWVNGIAGGHCSFGTDARGRLCNTIIWKENFTFKASLSLVEVNRGRSAVTFIWKDIVTEKYYPMFLKDLVETLLTTHVHLGVTEEREWTFHKRGSNYGIGVANNE